MKNRSVMGLKKIYFPALLPIIFVLASCGGNSDQHNSLADNFAHRDIIILNAPYQLSGSAATEMEGVINAYLQLKDALVMDDENAADKAAGLLAQKTAAVNPGQLRSEEHTSEVQSRHYV